MFYRCEKVIHFGSREFCRKFAIGRFDEIIVVTKRKKKDNVWRRNAVVVTKTASPHLRRRLSRTELTFREQSRRSTGVIKKFDSASREYLRYPPVVINIQ